MKTKIGAIFLIFLLIIFAAAFARAIQATPTIEFSVDGQAGNVLFEYQMYKNNPFDECLTLSVFQNGALVFSDRDVGECTKTNVLTIEKKTENDAFYAEIKYLSGGVLKTYTSQTKTLESSDSTPPVASNLEFLRNNIPLEKIAKGKSFSVTVAFDIQDEGLSSVTLDLSGITTDPIKKTQYSSLSIPVADCVKSNQTYSCKVHNKVLQPENETVKIGISMVDYEGNANSQILEKTFAISNDNPEITFFGTDRCDNEGKCYVKNGINNIFIQLTGSSAGFTARQVFYSIGGLSARVSDCSDTECTGKLNVDCGDGPKNLYITSSGTLPSQDDAGNLLSGKTSEIVFCDNTVPIINSLIVMPFSGKNFTKSGDTIEAVMNITESTKPKALANFSEFGGGVVEAECIKKQANWICKAQATVKPGPYTGTVRVSVFDVAGNSAFAEKNLEVLAVEQGTPPDLWKIQSSRYSPNVFNKKYLANGDNSLYVYLSLHPKQANAQTLYLEKPFCTSLDESGQAMQAYQGTGYTVTTTPQIQYLIMNNGDNSAILNNYRGVRNVMIKFQLRKSTSDYSTLKELKYQCSINIYSKWGDYFYSVPEQENFTITLRLLETDDIGTNIQDEITKTKQKAEESLARLQRYKSFSDTTKPICEIILKLNQLDPPLSAAASALEATGVGKPIGDTIRFTADEIDSLNDNLKKIPQGLAFCQFITCQHNLNTIVTKQLEKLPGVNEMSQFTMGGDYSLQVDPYKSSIMAKLTLCLPAIVATEERKQGINCEYARCLSQDVGSGYPISECKSAKSYAECKYYTGEIFEVIPYTNIQRRVGEVVKDTLTNPVNFLGTAALTTACKALPSNIGRHFCMLPKKISEWSKLKTQLIDKWFDPPKTYSTQSYCDSVLGNIDNKGYWVPYYDGSDFNTQVTHKYKDRTIICDPKLGCYFQDDKTLSVRTYEDETGFNGQMFTNAQYFGNIKEHNEDLNFLNPQDFKPETAQKVQESSKKYLESFYTNSQWDSEKAQKQIAELQNQKNNYQGYDADSEGNLIYNGQNLGNKNEVMQKLDAQINFLQYQQTQRAVTTSLTSFELNPETGEGIVNLVDPQALKQLSFILKYDEQGNIKTVALDDGTEIPVFDQNDELIVSLQKYGYDTSDKQKLLNELADRQVLAYYASEYQKNLLKQFKETNPELASEYEKYLIDAGNAYIDIQKSKEKQNNLEKDLATTNSKIEFYENEISRLKKDKDAIINKEYTEEAYKKQLANYQKELENLKSESKDTKKEIDEEKKLQKKLEKKTDDDDAFIKRKELEDATKGWKMVSFAFTTARGISAITSMFPGSEYLIKGWSERMHRLFNYDVLQGFLGDYESVICKNKVSSESPQQGHALVKTGSYYRSAAHVEGERSPLIENATGRDYYNYYFSAGVNIKTDNLGNYNLVFDIVVDGSLKLEQGIELNNDKPSYPGSEQGIIAVQTGNIYKEVCIVFKNPRYQLESFFDVIELENGNKVCNTIREQ